MTEGSGNSGSNGTGITFCGLLGIAFIVLRLTGVIHWSWVWVLGPLWIPAVIILIVAVILILWSRT